MIYKRLYVNCNYIYFQVSITCHPDIKSLSNLKKKKEKSILPPLNTKPKSILGKKRKIKSKLKAPLLTPLLSPKLPLLPPVLPIPFIPPLVPKLSLIPKLPILPPLAPLPFLPIVPPLIPLLPLPIIPPPKLPEITKPLKISIIKDTLKLKDSIGTKIKSIKLPESALQKKKVKEKLLKLKKDGSLTAAQYKRFSKALM